jgi:hypothetical protein
MSSISKPALALVLIMNAMTASAGKKRVTLDFQPAHPPSSPCLKSPFISWEESDLFFKGVKQVKSNHGVEYCRGNDIVQIFPDELTINVVFWHVPQLFGTCGAGFQVDPATVRFHAEWRNGSQTRTAKGTVIQSEPAKIGTVWCEDGCTESWQYQLRIESDNVSLEDTLVIRMDGEDGSPVAECIGNVAAVDAERTSAANLAPLP